jgi:hypothetical protein
VSSILDALAKLEASRQPTGLLEPGRPPAPPARRPLATMLVVGAFVAGAGVAAVVLWRRPVEAPAVMPAIMPAPPPPPPTVMAEAPVVAPVTPEPVVVARAPVDGLRTAPPVAAPAGQDLPWARTVTPPAPPPAEPAPSTGRLAVALAPRAEPPSLPAVPAEPPPVARPPEGAPNIRLSFLLYSAHPERRSVALTIDGGGLTTLHEGDDHEGVEVVRIRPDGAELRWQGEVFTVEARD